MNHDSRSDGYDYQRGYDVGYEKAVARAVDIACQALVRLASPIWHWGDGAGGDVLNTIGKCAADIGLPLPSHAQHYTRRSYVSRLAERDGWVCAYCGVPLGWGNPLVVRPEMDHVIPKCQGGSNGLDNLVLSCSPCNQAKAGRTPEQWRASEELAF